MPLTNPAIGQPQLPQQHQGGVVFGQGFQPQLQQRQSGVAPPIGGGAPGGAPSSGGGGGGFTFPGLSSGQMNITSAFGTPVLPFPNANLNAQSTNRNFEAAMGGPSREQMLNSIRPDSSGGVRTAGDQIKINGQLAQRAAGGANALAGTPYNQNIQNAQQLVKWMTGQGQDVTGQGQNLLGVSNAYGDYNLASLLSGMDQQFGQAAAGAGLTKSLLGGLLGGSGLGGLLG